MFQACNMFSFCFFSIYLIFNLNKELKSEGNKSPLFSHKEQKSKYTKIKEENLLKVLFIHIQYIKIDTWHYYLKVQFSFAYFNAKIRVYTIKRKYNIYTIHP